MELTREQRADAVASLKQYFDENMAEPLGDLPAELLLDFVLQEIGPAIYNKAVADASARMASRVSDLSGELFEDEFQYWARLKAKRTRAK